MVPFAIVVEEVDVVVLMGVANVGFCLSASR